MLLFSIALGFIASALINRSGGFSAAGDPIAVISWFILFPAYLIADGILNTNFLWCSLRAAFLPLAEGFVIWQVTGWQDPFAVSITIAIIYILGSLVVVGITRAVRKSRKENIYCPSCGKKTSENSAFCRHCGVKISGPRVAPAQPVTKEEHMQIKKRSPIYYGASGCALGFIIMVCFVAAIALAGPQFPISGQTYATILNVGSWVLPIGLGALGYLYGQREQKEKFQPVHKIKRKSNDKVYGEVEQVESREGEPESVGKKTIQEKTSKTNKGQSVQKVVGIMVCPNCEMKVVPKSDGTCPSCQSKII